MLHKPQVLLAIYGFTIQQERISRITKIPVVGEQAGYTREDHIGFQVLLLFQINMIQITLIQLCIINRVNSMGHSKGDHISSGRRSKPCKGQSLLYEFQRSKNRMSLSNEKDPLKTKHGPSIEHYPRLSLDQFSFTWRICYTIPLDREQGLFTHEIHPFTSIKRKR